MNKEEREHKKASLLEKLSSHSGRFESEQLQALLTEDLIEALAQHAEALTKSSEASDRYAGRLVWATWALVAATVGLIITGMASLLVQCGR